MSLAYLLAAVAGIVVVQRLPCLPAPSLSLAITVASLLCLLVRRLKLMAAFLGGLAWALVYATLSARTQLPAPLEGRDLVVEGEILDLPRRHGDGVRFDFRVENSDHLAEIPHKLRLNWYRTAHLPKAGERWHLTVRLKRPHGYFNPGGMDYEQWLFAQGIHATGYVRERTDNRRLAQASPSLSSWRQMLADRLDEALAFSPLRGIVKALTLGVEEDIEPRQWTVLRRTGTAHLVAISGSHIGLIAGWCFLLCRAVMVRLLGQARSPPRVAAVVALTAAWFYAALAGYAIPTQRALVMIVLVMGAMCLRRPVRPGHILALALLAVSLYDPLAVTAPGFWLSFAAVGLIVWILGGRLRPPGFWSALWRINGATALGLAPLLLVFFHHVSLVSPLANLFAVPLLGLVAIPLCLCGALLMLILPAAGFWLLTATEHFLQPVWWTLVWCADMPWAQWTHPSPPVWSLLLAAPGVALLLAPRGLPGRWLGAVLLLPCLTYTPPRVAAGGFRVTLLDVGQGLAAVAETQSHVLVFDTGARLGPRFDLGEAVVEPFLHQRAHARIDALVVSHGDNDHIGGAATLLRDFPVGALYSSVPERLPGAFACRVGQDWEWDGVHFAMLGPVAVLPKENDNSCVLKISTARGSVLFTGDIEQEGEAALLRRHGVALTSTVLIAPHHGSNTSSTREFLRGVAPRAVLVPVGYRNAYGFPHPAVLARYREVGSVVLDTAQEGAITLEFDARQGWVRTEAYRRSQGRYWNDRPLAGRFCREGEREC